MKLKTQKAISKRVKISPSGKALRVKAANSHLFSHKTNRVKVDIEINKADSNKIKKLLPYG